MINLHTHTTRCNHATGTDEEYVLAAIRNGYTTIGFSDHAPYIYPRGYYSGMRMRPEETQEYVDSLKALKEKYKDSIDVKIGFELEWYPKLIQKELEFLSGFDYDYLILGQHFTYNEYDLRSKYVGSETDSVAVLNKYVEQVLQGAQSGRFTYVCHPDLIHFTGSEGIYFQKMIEMLTTLKALDVPIEYNFYGYFDERNYPNDKFWRLAADIGNDVVIGLDAHWPEVYDDTERLSEMQAHIQTLGITPTTNITIR